MTGEDRFFVGICFSLMTGALVIVQLVAADHVARTFRENSAGVTFPDNLNVTVTNAQPIAVDIVQGTTPFDVKIQNQGYMEAVPVTIR